MNVSSTTGSLALTTAGTDFGGDAGRRLGYSTSKAVLNVLTVQYARAFNVEIFNVEKGAAIIVDMALQRLLITRTLVEINVLQGKFEKTSAKRGSGREQVLPRRWTRALVNSSGPWHALQV